MRACLLLITAFTMMSAAEALPTIQTVAGTGTKGDSGDGGRAENAKLNQPFGVAFDAAGNLYFSDTGNHRVRKVDAKSGIISTVAGNGKKGFSGDGGPAHKAMLNEPYGITFDESGNLFIVDRLNFCIRKVDAKSGFITTIAGTGGQSGFAGDGGPASQARFKEPNGLALDGKGTLYVADVADQRIRAIDLKTGTIRTFAGNGKKTHSGDGGPVKEACFAGPRAVAYGSDQCLYVVEREGNSVRRIDIARGIITRFAGTGVKGYSGDGGQADAATFNGPKEIDIDTTGNVYVVDTENEVIRRIDAKSGIITTVAGKGKNKMPGRGDGGPATAATLGRPHGVAIGPDGAFYIGDTNSHRVRRVK